MKNVVEDILILLKKNGFTKWEISKRLGVHWNTVNAWSKGMFKPSKEKQDILKKLLNNVK